MLSKMEMSDNTVPEEKTDDSVELHNDSTERSYKPVTITSDDKPKTYKTVQDKINRAAELTELISKTTDRRTFDNLMKEVKEILKELAELDRIFNFSFHPDEILKKIDVIEKEQIRNFENRKRSVNEKDLLKEEIYKLKEDSQGQSDIKKPDTSNGKSNYLDYWYALYCTRETWKQDMYELTGYGDGYTPYREDDD
jgi:hypothetical protein